MILLRKGKEKKSIYIAPFCTKVHTKRSGMDHTVLPANNTMPACWSGDGKRGGSVKPVPLLHNLYTRTHHTGTRGGKNRWESANASSPGKRPLKRKQVDNGLSYLVYTSR